MPQIHAIYDATSGKLHRAAEETSPGKCPAFFDCSKSLMLLITQGYDISFLITNTHSETMLKHKIVDFIIQ